MTKTTAPLTPQIETVLREAGAAVEQVAGARIGTMVTEALIRTIRDTITLGATGAFVVTGDIPAMWLRDSTTQMTPYLRMLQDSPDLANLVAAVVRRQLSLLDHDSYANAFNDGPTGAHYEPDDVCDDPHVWEQKYELDSLAYPVTLAHALWRATGDTSALDERAHRVLGVIVDQIRLEQDHARSGYRFQRTTDIPTETLARDGLGTEVAVTGMTWQAFRPSDDACTYHYNVPGNLFAAQALRKLAEIAEDVFADTVLAGEARALGAELVDGVRGHGVVDGPLGERIYAYEVDGRGGVLLMDDANTPSLLSLPLIAPDVLDRRVWEATRRFVLSEHNPYYVSGSVAAGVGSPHTLPGRVWPIALAVQGLVGDAAERRTLLDLIAATDAGTGHIHESFDVSDASAFSRPWFSWADSMFCELALAVVADERAAS